MVFEGADSVTAPGEPGVSWEVMHAIGIFGGLGSPEGVMRLKHGSNVVWEAPVSGGLSMFFPGGTGVNNPPAGASVTLELSGGRVNLRVRSP